MVWIVIALGMLFVAAPIVWIMPTPAQRRVERLRAHARGIGLETVSCELPQARRERVRGESPRRGMLYRVPWPRDADRATVSGRWVRTSEGTWETDSDAVAAAIAGGLLASMPLTVRAVELGPRGPGVYWNEQGDAATIDAFATVLTAVRERMLAAPRRAEDDPAL